MTGREFLRKLEKLGQANNTPVTYNSSLGKGSHGRVFYGAEYTTLKDPKKQIGAGLLGKMCRDLGIKTSDL